MIDKLLIKIFKKRINICVEEYQIDPTSYLSKRYRKRMQIKLNAKKALKQDLFIPEIGFRCIIEVISSIIGLIFGILVLLWCPFYNLYKLLMFPGRLYLSRVVRAEILRRINNG